MQSTDSEPQDDNKPDDSDELHRKILKQIKDSRRHFAQWREDAKEDYDFYAGSQWAQEDIDVLTSQGRPPVVFNRTARTVNSVTGLEVQNRQEVNYFPRQIGNAGKSEMLTGAAKWSRDECDAEDEESESFEDTIICGMGWTETRLDYETDPEGVILIERFDPFEGYVDPTAKKRNCDDSRYRGRIKSYTVEEFQARWPEIELPTMGRFFESEEEERQIQDLSPGSYSPDNQDIPSSNLKLIEVAQHQYYETYKVHMVQDNQGQMIEMPEEQFNQRKSVMDAAGMKYTKQAKPKRRYVQCFLTPDSIIEKEPCPVDDFTLHIITGLRDRNNNTWFGIVRMMKDPQRWANKWLSQIQHILNTQAKSGKLLWETGAFKNPRKAKEEWSSSDAMAELNAGGLAKVEQIQPAQYPDGIDRLLQYALSAVNDVPGVNLELMGLANRDQANVLEQSRKQAGVTILAKFFDSLRRYRKKQGRVLAEFIQQYISDGRLIRISGELGPQYIQLIRDPGMLKYDVVVDDAPTSTNMKEKTFAAVQAILPMVLQEGIPVPPDLLDYTPLPEDLIQKWKKFIQEKSQDPEVQQQKQIAMAGQQADVQSKQADAQSKTSKSQLDQANAAKIVHEIQSGSATASLQMEQQKSSQELQLKAEQIKQELTLKREEMLLNNQLKRDDMLLKHQVSQQDNQMRAESMSKPTVQIGDEKGFANISDTLNTGLENNSSIIIEGFKMLGESMINSNRLLAEAITAPKKLILDKNKKPIGVETVSAL